MRLTVVIPTYNRPDALPRALAALDRQTLAPDEFELVIAEDAKNEAAVDASERPYAVRRVRGRIAGASSARNAGWRAAQAPLVLFLGDDIIASATLLERHLAAHERAGDQRVGVLGHVRWADELPRTSFMAWLDRGIQSNYATIPGTEAGPGHLYTTNVSLPRAALQELDGFDEEAFPFLYEDIDLGVRLFERGYRLVYDPQADAEHLHEPTLESWRARMATVARAERNWVARHPELPPYFHSLFENALAQRRRRGWAGRALLKRTPLVWRNADLYYRQQLGPAFMRAWDDAQPALPASSAGSPPGGPK